MSDFTLFLGKFLRHGTKIASLAPSSPWLSRATVRGIDWERAKVVVELGAGTGPITRVLAERAKPDCRVIVLERDADFANLLRDRFAPLPHFEVIEGDVRDLAAILADRDVKRVDHVVSGLPVPSFPKELRRSLFEVVREVLALEGSYHQITELAWVYQGLYRKYFDDVRFYFEPRNIPPAGAYVCRGPKKPD
jgi:ornithine lipid N-methyltransferase